MKILISLRAHRPQTQGGMGDYIDGLVREIGKLAKKSNSEVYLLTTFFNHHLYQEEINKEEIKNVKKIMLNRPENYSNEIDEWVNRLAPDIIFYPLPYPVSNIVRGKRLISCIQDLQHEYFKEFFPVENLILRYKFYDECAIYSKKIITLSNHSKSTISNIYHIPPEKIVVISPALDETINWDPSPTQIDQTLNKYQLSPGYLFYPANFWPHKNHEILFRALKNFKILGYKKIKLVLTGQMPTNPKLYRTLINKYGLEKEVIHLGYVPRKDMPSLYWGALALVFPSFFEGFGIPILEAFKTKCPVIAARTTSIPEVARDGALYFDPLDEKELIRHIQTIIENQGVRESLMLKGADLVNQFSYKRSAEILWKTFEKLLQPCPIEVRQPPKVSIVTPSLNQARFIRETIDSVLSQGYPYLEYWVIDGESTDGTLEILKTYGDKIQWVSERDKGQTNAINKGFSKCSGEIFGYLNSDDILYPGMVKKIVDQYLKNPDVSIFYGKGDWINEKGEVIGPYNGGSFTFENLHGHCIICQPASMFTSLVYRRIGGFDERRTYAMDYDFWIKAAVRGFKFHYIDENLAASRLHTGTKTAKNRFEIHQEIFDLQRELIGYVHPQWILSFSNLLKTEWKGRRGVNTLIPQKVWFLILKSYYYFLPKRKELLLNKYKNIIKKIRKKIFRYPPYMGSGFDGNWVGPNLKLKYVPPRRIERLEMGGVAFFPFKLRVFINGKYVHSQDIPTGEFILRVDPKTPIIHKIRITANHCIMPFPPILNYKISYRLNWTNFFDDLSFPICLSG